MLFNSAGDVSSLLAQRLPQWVTRFVADSRQMGRAGSAAVGALLRRVAEVGEL